MVQNIEYRVFERNELSDDLIFDFLKENDDALYPSLSDRVDLKAYSHKLSERAIHFVALKENKIIALLSLYFNLSPKDSYIPFFCVNHDYQGLAIGKKIMQMSIDYCIKRGSSGISLTVRKDNFTAVKFYERNDFRLVDEDYYTGTEVRLLLMKRVLY